MAERRGAVLGEGVDTGARRVGEDLVGENDLPAVAVVGVDLDGGVVDEHVQAQPSALEREGSAVDSGEAGIEVDLAGGGAVQVDLSGGGVVADTGALLAAGADVQAEAVGGARGEVGL